ncbi:MAG: ATP-binding protein, partial [Bacillota bacterium]
VGALFFGRFTLWAALPGATQPRLGRRTARTRAPAPAPPAEPAGETVPRRGRDRRAFDGLVGLDEPIGALKLALELPVLHPDRVKKYRLRPDRGLLLVGPPGTGKTSLARAAARYFGCAFRSVNTAHLLGPYVGQSERNLHEVFHWARQNRPCILFLDEIDAIGRRRDGSHLNRPHDVLLDILLQELDGFEDRAGVFVLAATNRADILDEALVRPGRFDRIIRIGLPDRQARLKLLEMFLRDRPGWDEFDRSSLERLADLTEGKSPAEIRNMVDRAVTLAALKDEPVQPRHLGL